MDFSDCSAPPLEVIGEISERLRAVSLIEGVTGGQATSDRGRTAPASDIASYCRPRSLWDMDGGRRWMVGNAEGVQVQLGGRHPDERVARIEGALTGPWRPTNGSPAAAPKGSPPEAAAADR